MCLPYWTTHINPELRDFGSYRRKDQLLPFLRAFGLQKTQTSTFSEMFLSDARDLLMRVSHGSMTTISLGLQISEFSTFNLSFPLKCADFYRVSFWIGRLRFTSALRASKISILNFSSLALSRSAFTRSTRSVDVCPSMD
jgi:hypothetical protein